MGSGRPQSLPLVAVEDVWQRTTPLQLRRQGRRVAQPLAEATSDLGAWATGLPEESGESPCSLPDLLRPGLRPVQVGGPLGGPPDDKGCGHSRRQGRRDSQYPAWGHLEQGGSSCCSRQHGSNRPQSAERSGAGAADQGAIGGETGNGQTEHCRGQVGYAEVADGAVLYPEGCGQHHDGGVVAMSRERQDAEGGEHCHSSQDERFSTEGRS